MSRVDRLDTVQALRFIAAALVLGCHATYYLKDRVDASLDVWTPGAAGANIFFVVSGLVMVLSTASQPHDAAHGLVFFKRRLARVAPVYWLATSLKLLLLGVLPAAALHTAVTWPNVIGSYLFVPTVDALGQVKPVHGVGWTLMHEMYFYALFAVGMALRMSPVLFAGAAIGATTAVGWVFDVSGPLASVYLDPVNTLFVAGMVLGVCHLRGLRLSWRASLLLAALGLLGTVFPDLLLGIPAYPKGLDIASPATVAGFLFLNRHLAGRIPRGLLSLGDSSYSLYIFHPFIGPVMAAAFAMLGLHAIPLAMVLMVLTSIVCCHGIYRLIELPILRRLKHPPPKPARIEPVGGDAGAGDCVGIQR